MNVQVDWSQWHCDGSEGSYLAQRSVRHDGYSKSHLHAPSVMSFREEDRNLLACRLAAKVPDNSELATMQGMGANGNM